MTVVMFHHPNCGTSRQTLTALEARGIKPELVFYMDGPLKKADLRDILNKMNASAHDLVRIKDADAMGLDVANLEEDELLDIMLENRRLIQRPIVLANDKAALGRPPESVFDIL